MIGHFPFNFDLRHVVVGTLGARDFSCAVSGFGRVLKDVAARVFGLRPTKRSSPSHARKNLWYPGYVVDGSLGTLRTVPELYKS